MILKKGIQVKVISGKDKGKTGEILEIDRKAKKHINGKKNQRNLFLYFIPRSKINIAKKEKI